MIDDPASPAIYRRSGAAPYPQPGDPLPSSIQPRSLVLRDRTTKATLIPFSAPSQVPLSLLDYLRQQLNREIEKGDTYPMIDNFTFETFGPYWFQNFGAVMLLGDIAGGADEVRRMEEQEGGVNWEKQCLGSFYIKPNYPGRSSHVCNGGFLVTDGARNRGVGRLMGECYLEWAPLLGYTYSVFNLVYETNVASCRIWDALGFKRIGRVPGCGNLATQPEGHFVDAIIYGRHLGYKKEDADDERRFERIKYYLKTGKYPGDADSAEKNRLRAAVRNYTLVESGGGGKNGATGVDGGDGSSGGGGGGGHGGGDGISGGGGDKLMLGDKEVISEPRMQYEIARRYHRQNKDTHAGINKTTATVSEKYHWNRIKTTVTEVIENCTECNEKLKKKSLKAAAAAAASNSNNHGGGGGGNGGSARKISGGEMSAGIANAPLSQSSSSENLLLASASSAPTPTPAAPPPPPEFVFQHEFAVVDGSSAAGSAAATPRASPSVSEMHYGDDDMALDPHNIAMLSSAVQNLGSSVDGVGGGDPSSSSVGGPFQSPPLHQSSFGESFSDPYHHHHHHHHHHPDGLTTSIDPASLQQYHHHHHHDQHPVTHQQYLSPYQPLADGADHFGSPSRHHLGQGFLDQDGVIIDDDSSDTQQQPFGAS
ncbi:Protein SPT10 [Lasiodiplodia hormozganensis]|uniref:Protein SPT10 n=1 Tax=Lasiodiplodia hormozganensis TaxID=869390 RepID=A0AA39XY54_9PEZI|nr:Protein SPT10 [Lasiodiplodia hormozganensis]